MTTDSSKLLDGQELAGVSGYIPNELQPSQSSGVAGSDGSVKPHDCGAAHRLKHLDLFSGIGGFALAAQWAGIETIGFSEIDKYARRVLAKNFPGVMNYGDITRIQNKIECDIITGGFPCQPFSLAGKRRGKEDDRYLWPEMLRVIALCRPAWVVGENVPGIINMELDSVLSDLGAEGYQVQTFAIPACALGARHRRNRIWIVGDLKCRNAPGGGTTTHRPSSYFGERTTEEIKPKWEGRLDELVSRGIAQRADTYANARRVLHGIPDWVDRLRGLGNAIVPQVAFVFLDAIRRVELDARELMQREKGSLCAA